MKLGYSWECNCIPTRPAASSAPGGLCYNDGMLNPKAAADLLHIAPNTLRRWASELARFMSPGANPPDGQPRKLNEHDLRVLYLVAGLRDSGVQMADVISRLESDQANDWADLPQLPFDLFDVAGDGVIDQTKIQAYEVAQVAALQTQLQFVASENRRLQTDFQAAQERVSQLEGELAGARDQLRDTERQSAEGRLKAEEEKRDIERRLLEARADVARLEGQLSGYSFGRKAPVNVGVLLLGAALIGAVLVVIAAVVLLILGSV